jgi:hypothetical protein
VDFSKLTRCVDLKGDHVATAVQSSEAMSALVRRFAQIAKPESGGALILVALARLGTTACDWIDGELHIELLSEGSQTRIVVASSIGAGLREAPFPSVLIGIPLAEFTRMIAKTPRIIEPLKMAQTAKGLVLTATEEARRTSLPPPMVSIDPRSIIGLPPQAVPSPSPSALGTAEAEKPTVRPPSLPDAAASPKIPRPTPKKT